MATRVVLMPHKTASNESIIWGSWQISTANRFYEPGGEVAEWDYATDCTIRGTVHIDRTKFLQETGLESLADVTLVSQVDCPSTYVRSTKSMPLSNQDPSTFTIDIEMTPGEFAGHITTSLHLVLNTNRPAAARGTAAMRKGSRLAKSPSWRLNLEADTARFPTEALPFTAALPNNVPWILSIIYDDLNSSFLGSVRLLVNTEHPGGRVALDGGHPNSRIVRSALRTDILRELLQHVAAHESSEDLEDREFDEDSIGYLIESICRNELHGSITQILRMIATDPIEFDARLQANTNYLLNAEDVV